MKILSIFVAFLENMNFKINNGIMASKLMQRKKYDVLSFMYTSIYILE